MRLMHNWASITNVIKWNFTLSKLFYANIRNILCLSDSSDVVKRLACNMWNSYSCALPGIEGCAGSRLISAGDDISWTNWRSQTGFERCADQSLCSTHMIVCKRMTRYFSSEKKGTRRYFTWFSFMLALTNKHVLSKFSTFAMGWEWRLHNRGFSVLLSGLFTHSVFYLRVNF